MALCAAPWPGSKGIPHQHYPIVSHWINSEASVAADCNLRRTRPLAGETGVFCQVGSEEVTLPHLGTRLAGGGGDVSGPMARSVLIDIEMGFCRLTSRAGSGAPCCATSGTGSDGSKCSTAWQCAARVARLSPGPDAQPPSVSAHCAVQPLRRGIHDFAGG